ncbi:JAB domain-containing protein [Bullifex porci]|uniref:JAB domain-containing protein n=1 Tax=Bullifex porci TaxID=2606638 RepID=UPI0030B80710
MHPREVFSDPIARRATAIILAHNHPSGILEPSREDITTTSRLAESGEILGIKVIDHLIFSTKSYYSFREHGLM